MGNFLRQQLHRLSQVSIIDDMFLVFGFWLLVPHLKLCLTSHFDYESMEEEGGQVCSICNERKSSECFYEGRKQCKDCLKKKAKERADKLKGR